MNPFVFAVFSYLILVFWGFILCFTHFGGSSLSLQFVSLPRSVAWRATWETREGKKMDSYGSGGGGGGEGIAEVAEN